MVKLYQALEFSENRKCFYDPGVGTYTPPGLIRTAYKENRFDLLPESAQRVLVDMRFNLGYQGFRKFKKMIKAVKQQDFHTAAREMKESPWYHQVGARAERLTKMMQGSADSSDSADTAP